MASKPLRDALAVLNLLGIAKNFLLWMGDIHNEKVIQKEWKKETHKEL
jgi:hypothetical protein